MTARELPRLYRRLLRTCAAFDPALYGQTDGNLVEHAMYRVRTERALDLDGLKEGERVSAERLEEGGRMLRDVDAVLSEMVHMEAADAPSLFSFLNAAHGAAGSPEYHRQLEAGLLQVAEFHTAFQARLKLEETRNGEMKNRAMQIATRPHADLLKHLEDGLYEIAHPENADGAGGYQEKVQNVDLQMEWHFLELPELVAVGIDDERKRVKIAVASHLDIRDNAYDEHVAMQDWGVEPEGCAFIADYNQAVTKILRELEERRILPEGYTYTLMGHSIGGAIAVILAAHLQAEHARDIVNVITFGQPRVTDDVGSSALSNLPMLRIVTPLDGFQHTPTASDRGRPFQTYGEALLILPAKLKDIADEEFIDANQLYVTMSEYHLLMHEDNAVVDWEPEPDHMAFDAEYSRVARHDPDEVARNKVMSYKARTRRSARKGNYDPTKGWQ